MRVVVLGLSFWDAKTRILVVIYPYTNLHDVTSRRPYSEPSSEQLTHLKCCSASVRSGPLKTVKFEATLLVL
jgi:hypothetical protein